MALPTSTPSPSQPEDAAATGRSPAGALRHLLFSAAAPPPALRLPCFLGGAGKFPYDHIPCLCRSSIRLSLLLRTAARRSYRRVAAVAVAVVRSPPRFWAMLLYFVSTSLLGFLFLKFLAPPAAGTPGDLDLFFMAVSAVTVSSMSTAEMGALSTGQLVVVAVLMLMGGEVFTSIAELLHLMLETELTGDPAAAAAASSAGGAGTVVINVATELTAADGNLVELRPLAKSVTEQRLKKYESLKRLGGVVFVYLMVAHVTGAMAFLLYLVFSNPEAPRRVLAERGVTALGFSVFMAISSFSNAGFVPLNEGMAPFKQSPGALLLIVPLVLAGNTLFPPLLRWAVRLSTAVAGGGVSEYILGDGAGEMGFQHLLSSGRSACLVVTVAGFVLLQVVAFCCVEWGGAALEGLSPFQKVVGGLYMAVNSRHAGESPFDLSAVSPAVLLLYVVMMYLPPYTSFVPTAMDREEIAVEASSRRRHDGDGQGGGGEVDRGAGEPLKKTEQTTERGGGGWMAVMWAAAESLSMSHLSYLAVCVTLICITERRRLVRDPLNFNVLYIVVEVISAYGNVGFSTGYSCARRRKAEGGGGGECKDASYGFVGWWSGGGKLILIVVMYFGRLKKYTYVGRGQGWKLIS